VDLVNVVRKTLATVILMGGFALGAACERSNINYSREQTAKAIETGSTIYHGNTESSRRLIEIQKNRIENGCPGDYASMAITGLVGALVSCMLAFPFVFRDDGTGCGTGLLAAYRDEWENVWQDSDCSVPYHGFEDQNGGWS